MRKHFNFKNTIQSGTYMFRMFISTLFIFAGLDCGKMSMLMIIVGVWLQLSTIVKRVRAILPENSISLFLSSLVLGFAIEFVFGSYMVFMPYPVFVLWIAFARSDTYYHEG